MPPATGGLGGGPLPRCLASRPADQQLSMRMASRPADKRGRDQEGVGEARQAELRGCMERVVTGLVDDMFRELMGYITPNFMISEERRRVAAGEAALAAAELAAEQDDMTEAVDQEEEDDDNISVMYEVHTMGDGTECIVILD